jgi:hypothetical protein
LSDVSITSGISESIGRILSVRVKLLNLFYPWLLFTIGADDDTSSWRFQEAQSLLTVHVLGLEISHMEPFLHRRQFKASSSLDSSMTQQLLVVPA